MSTNLIRDLKRELPRVLLLVLVFVGLPGTVFFLILKNPPKVQNKPEQKKRDTYKFELCTEASRSDGNGFFATADKCGKYLEP